MVPDTKNSRVLIWGSSRTWTLVFCYWLIYPSTLYYFLFEHLLIHPLSLYHRPLYLTGLLGFWVCLATSVFLELTLPCAILMIILWLLYILLGHHQFHSETKITQEALYSPLATTPPPKRICSSSTRKTSDTLFGACQPPFTRSKAPCPNPSRNGIMGRNVSMVLYMWPAQCQESPALWTVPSRTETGVPTLPRSSSIIGLGSPWPQQPSSWNQQQWESHGKPRKPSRSPSRPQGYPKPQIPAQRPKQPKGPKQPAPEPDWKSFQQAGQPSPQPAPVDPQIQALLATLAKQRDLSPEVQVALAEVQSSSNKLATKHIHGAVSKLGSAQKGLDAAVLARQNLHATWRACLTDAVSRWHILQAHPTFEVSP